MVVVVMMVVVVVVVVVVFEANEERAASGLGGRLSVGHADVFVLPGEDGKRTFAKDGGFVIVGGVGLLGGIERIACVEAVKFMTSVTRTIMVTRNGHEIPSSGREALIVGDVHAHNQEGDEIKAPWWCEKVGG